ncbi:MAG TPA: LuxR C-terminal-related transcriptional regulator [Actinomycetota bacterium]|nr:LuxR C-terminal-related transcriptional regulator [Actinomycetota bacterium]
MLALLDEGAQGPLTLLAAPAGYGKTLLLASWAATARPPGAVAWVTVGPDDAQPPTFWGHVLDALAATGIAPAEGSPAGLDPRLDGGHLFVRSLASWLAELPAPVVLVLDDLHEAGGEAVATELRLLLRFAPPQLRLVVATRADPPLSLQRLRVAGQLQEIREAELAFTRSEAGDLLGRQGVELSADELEVLLRRTEGWAAGLRLAALTLREHPLPGRFVDELAGDDRAIAGYLLEEVLAVQPPELRAFLLRTSVPDRICGGLADALTGGADGAEVLARLEREHVFTMASGPGRDWYRYHPLFAELLRAELRHERPEELPALHRAAAGWQAANDLPVEAVRSALAGGDLDQAIVFLTGGWLPLLVEGQAAALGELLARLPAERMEANPELAAVAALSRLALGELEEADAWLGLAEAGAARAGAALPLARLWRARLAGDAAGALAAAGPLLDPGGDAAWERLARPDDRRTLALALLGAAQLWSGQLEEAAGHLEQAVADAGRSGRELVGLDASAHLAVLEALRGNLGRAVELGRLVVGRARRGRPAAPLACAELAIASAAYYRDELGPAAAALARAIRSAGRDHMVALGAAILGAFLAAGPDDQAEALARLDAAVAAVGDRPPRLLAGGARAARAQLLAAAGDDIAAMATLDEEAAGREPVEAVSLARLQLARGEPAAAMATVAPLLAAAPGRPAADQPSLAIQASLVDAAATQELGDHDAAARALRRALDLAGPEGFRRAFVEGGTPVRALLVDHLHRESSHRALADTLLARLRDTAGATASPVPAAAAAALIEPLSEREQVVLRYLPSTLSAGEIADELFVSLNTVKTHIRSIYRKLDTNRRWDTVRRARQLQLL